MKTKKMLSAAVALMMLAACTQEEIEPATERVPVKLAYTTVDATETRAAQNLNEGTFESGESVTVRISNTGRGEWTDYAFTTGAAGAMTASAIPPYYPPGSQNIDIVAYYPATAGTSFSVATDQTADADYKASDLMFASVTNQAKQAEAVELAFSHKMAKLNVNITAGQGVTSITGVSILNVKPTVSFDQATGAVGEATGAATRIAMSNNGAALIPAQTIDGGLLSIATDKGTATYNVTNKTFAAGNKYTLNITVNLREVGATTAITNWNSGETSQDDADINPVATATTPAGLEAVDLGHPGGVMWANMNVGAKSPEEVGDFFAWGATVPFYQEGYSQENPCEHWIDGKTAGYKWVSYPFIQSGLSEENEQYHNRYITKYTIADGLTDGIWYDGSTFKGDNGDGVEHKDFASYNYVDDAARANWGGGWRTPTDAEWTWLRENCECVWTEDYNGTGVKGSVVTSNVNGNTIFLPAAGCHSGNMIFWDYGQYWSSTIGTITYRASGAAFSSSGADLLICERQFGLNIRPVKE